MKRILITGATGYIGTNVVHYLSEYNKRKGQECYIADCLSLRDAAWEDFDFSPYDTILHLAGKAHADIGHVSEETKQEYYNVNCELAVRTATKAKEQGVPHFVYLSSIIVYGDSANVGKRKCITANTKETPANFYGDSKWQAEQKLRALEEFGEDKPFYVAVVRPPMVYGKGSKGNFPLLAKLAAKTPIFPNVRNERSMIYIENLVEFLRLLIDSGQGGVYLPQNAEYVTTAKMVKVIGEVQNKKICLLGVLNPFVWLASKLPGKIGGMANKAFGSLSIAKEFSYKEMTGVLPEEIKGYRICDFEESVYRSIDT